MTLVRSLQLAGLAALFVSVAAFVTSLLHQPMGEPPRHGLRGLKRAKAMADGGIFPVLEPVLRWTAARVETFVPAAFTRDIERTLVTAGDLWGLSATEVLALTLWSGCFGLVFGAAYTSLFGGGLLFVALLAVFGFAAPRLQISGLARERVRKIERSLPHLVDLLVLALGAGLDFPAALRQVVEKSSDPSAPVIEELSLVLQELKLGRTRQQALEQLAARAPCDSVRDLVAAAVQSEEQGTPLGAVLHTQATTTRQRRSTRAEETAAKAGTAMMLPMVLLFFAVLILIAGPIILNVGPKFKGL
jgi:tight adherence protein C